MKTASALLQTLALGALLAAQVHGAITMPGVRQALRIIAGQPAPVFCASAVHGARVGALDVAYGSIEPCP